jgi:hypothetical protein
MNAKKNPPDPKPARTHAPVNPSVAPTGVPGFHHKTEEEDGRKLAGMELDTDTDPERVDTGTGDQPGNTHGSRFPVSSDEV